MASDRVTMIRNLLQQLNPGQLEIIDESHLHAGHAGAKDGRGHFAIRIASPCFTNKTLLEKHKLIYAALGNLMQTDIHALRITIL